MRSRIGMISLTVLVVILVVSNILAEPDPSKVTESCVDKEDIKAVAKQFRRLQAKLDVGVPLGDLKVCLSDVQFEASEFLDEYSECDSSRLVVLVKGIMRCYLDLIGVFEAKIDEGDQIFVGKSFVRKFPGKYLPMHVDEKYDELAVGLVERYPRIGEQEKNGGAVKCWSYESSGLVSNFCIIWADMALLIIQHDLSSWLQELNDSYK